MSEGARNPATMMTTEVARLPRLWELVSERTPGLLARYGGYVREAARRYGGSLAEPDGERYAATFDDGAKAIAAAVEIQRSISSDPEMAPLRVRIAVHGGESAAARCVRIREVAHGGQIVVSAKAAVPTPGVGFRSLGQHRLRDLLRPEEFFQVVADGIDEEFPGLASLNGSNVPIQFTTFVGREGEIAGIGDALRRTRLLTLLGPGGVGKTRLAYQVAAETASRYAGGASVVELADVPSGPAIAVATALGVEASAQGAVERALAGLRDRRLLLVLDNCEHLLEEVCPLVRAILAECPGVTVLATSRQAIGVPPEEGHEILPLTLPPESPDDPARVLESESGRLFVERAGERLTLSVGNMGAIAAICRRLDGLPLAIELAAARCDTLSPQEILDRLAHRFETLAADPDAADRRHRTMQEAIEWSNGLLTPAERTLLERLTAFRGGWTLESVDSALRISWDHLEDPFDVLRSLVEKSLVTAEDMVGDALRYRFLETVREFVSQTMLPERTEVASRGLFDWAEDFGARASAGMEGSDQRRWFDRVDLEWENLRLAITYGFVHPELRTRSLRLAVGLHRYWVVRGYFALGRALLESVLDTGEAFPDDIRAKAVNLVGVLALCQGKLDAAALRLTESLALARAAGDVPGQGATLCNLAMIAWERTDYVFARAAFEEGIVILEAVGDGGKVGIALLNLGCVLIDMDLLDEARETLKACIGPLREAGSVGGLAFADGNLGYLAIVRGDWSEAARHVRDSLGAFGQVGDWKGTMNTLVSAATLLASAHDLEHAATIRGAIEKMSATAGAAPTPRDDRRLAEIDRTLEGAPNAASLEALRLKGLSMSPQHGVEYALYALMAAAPLEEEKAKLPPTEMTLQPPRMIL